MSQTTVTPDEVRRRTILRSDWVPCKAAFIDCRTPGSDQKDNYSFIGSGVSQSAQQFVNLTEPHGFSLGAAGMPRGTTNSLHMHFTAEVFINFGGEYRLRWGADGSQGEYVSTDGDIISVPTWIFRGFTNEGPDDGILLTVLGRDDTGGIIWGPTVLKEAEGYGLRLTADNRLVDTAAGDEVPTDVELISPMPPDEIDRLDRFTVEQFRTRVITPADRRWVERPFLCSGLPEGNAQLAPVIGYGMVEDRRVIPPLHEPHNFNLAWLRATAGEGMLRHRHEATQVVTVKSGRWEVRLNTDGDEQTVALGPQDTLSIPAGAWRSFTMVDPQAGQSATPGWGELLVVNGGDGRVTLEWDAGVVTAARGAGQVLDANSYLAPTSVLNTATEDE
jgi:quercetin dioxygenase-like cupin family protein